MFDAAEQLRQLLQGDHLPFSDPVWLRGRPEPGLAVRDIVHDAGLGADGDAVADLEVAGQPDLAAEAARRRETEINGAFHRSGVEALSLSTDDDLVRAIVRMVTLRRRRRR